MDLWNCFEIPLAQTRFFQVGPRQFWVQRRPAEWYVATALTDDDEHHRSCQLDVAAEKPAHLAWERWCFPSDSNRLSLLPVMPDRPLVVRPEAPMRILSGTHYRFFVGVSFGLRLAVGLAKDHSLGEYPTQIFSKTWLGSPVEGEVCYALRTRAHREHQLFTPRLTRALCPVLVTNLAPGYLAFERLCVRGENLTLYADGNQVWANELHLTYQGDVHGSHVETATGAPPEAGTAARELTRARVPLGGNVLRRSFSVIRSLAEQPLWKV